MAYQRRFADRDRLRDVARAAFGPGRSVTGLTRLRGGSKKGVYRLGFDDESSAVVYVWDESESYWSHLDAGIGEHRVDPFSEASGVDLFEGANACLGSLGVRTPHIYLVDRTRSDYPADVAVVEDVTGPTLEAHLRHDPRDAQATLAQLGEALGTMGRHRGEGFGKVTLVDGGEVAQGSSCHQVVLERAIVDLAEAAGRVERIAAVHHQLERVVRDRAASVTPRAGYGLVHGELGPDHVLVGAGGEPVLIDIEGLMYFDVEWEHAFIRFRFGEHYSRLRSNRLDDRRLRLYSLAHSLSCVAGPLRLLDGDFPERDAMLRIIAANVERTLDVLDEPDD